MSVVLRYWAAAKAAAGVAEESYEAATLAELVALAGSAHADTGLPRVLGVCSYLVDGDPVGTRAHDGVTLPDGAEVEALPPFAGG